MPYTFPARIRYTECDESGVLTPLAIINYMQDCSTFQSEELGVGIAFLKERHRAWFLNAWQIIIDRYPRFGETIEVGTFAHGFQGIYGFRHFFMKDAKGAYIVRADSTWFLCDTDHMLPQKATEEYALPYMEAELPELSMPKAGRKIAVPKVLTAGEAVTVTRHHLDSNHHVNNAQYVEMAINAAGLSRPKEIRAQYLKAAVLGDRITPMIGSDEAGAMVISLAAENGKPYAAVRLLGAADAAEE